MRRPIRLIGYATLVLCAPLAPAQEHEHSHDSQTLGEVHFPTS